MFGVVLERYSAAVGGEQGTKRPTVWDQGVELQLDKADIFKCRCEISQSLDAGAEWQDMPDGRVLVENMMNWDEDSRPQFEEMCVQTAANRVCCVCVPRLPSRPFCEGADSEWGGVEPGLCVHVWLCACVCVCALVCVVITA